jgi:hypothetical protein
MDYSRIKVYLLYKKKKISMNFYEMVLWDSIVLIVGSHWEIGICVI